MDHRKGRKALTICCIIAVVLILIGWLLSTASATMYIGLGVIIAAVVLVIAGVIVAIACIRCPHCDGPLYYRGAPKPKFCPHCGNPIEW